jgi:hypothetical protein
MNRKHLALLLLAGCVFVVPLRLTPYPNSAYAGAFCGDKAAF